MTGESVKKLTNAAEEEWLESFVAGPGASRSRLLDVGSTAPDLVMPDDTGASVQLSSLWTDGPALLMFWRHFGCGCGIDRAARLNDEFEGYVGAGINPVVIGQGEPERAAAYRDEYDIPCPILCDPDHTAYGEYGLAHFGIEQVLYDAPEEMWEHTMDVGIGFQEARREMGRPLVDDPWMAPGEFLVDRTGTIRVSYAYQYCEDFPDPRVFTTAARLPSGPQ